MPRLIWPVITALSLALCRVCAGAQQPAAKSAPDAKQIAPPVELSQAAPVPMLRASTHSVVLDVVVTDQKGRPVRGLVESDFRLSEAGVPQVISSFEAVSGGASHSAQEAPRTVLLIDELNSEFEDLAFARYSLGKLLHRTDATGQPAKLDQPMALYALTNRGLEVVCDYTREPDLLRSALDRRPPVLPWRLHRGLYVAEERLDLSMSALQQMALSNVDVPGRKNLVWISPGFPIFQSLEITPQSQNRLYDAIRRLSGQLLSARMSVYSVDPRGVIPYIANPRLNAGGFYSSANYGAYVNALSRANDAVFGDLAVQTLALQTGGRAMFGRNDVDREIASSMAEGATYYTVPYTPANRNYDGAFRKVSVTLSHPELQIRTRDGYYALPDDPETAQNVVHQEMLTALQSPLHYTALAIPITYVQTSKSPDRVHIRVVLPRASLTWSPGADGMPECHVYAAAMEDLAAEKGRRSFERSFRGRITANGNGTGVSPSAMLSFDVPVHYPVGRMRIVVRDGQTGRMGSTDLTHLTAPAGPASFTGLQNR